MRKISLIISLLLVLVMIFSACDKNIDNNNNNNNQNTNSVVEKEEDPETKLEDEPDLAVGEKIKVTYMGISTNSLEMEENKFVELSLEEKFNIELDFSATSSSDKEQIDMLISAQALPDCGWVYSGVSAEKALGYFEDGVTRSIPIELVEKNAPNYWAMVITDPSYHNFQLDEETGDYYTMYSYRYKYSSLGWCINYRLDWMETLNITPIGNVTNIKGKYYITDEAYTIDDFTDIIYDFTYSDPDLNNIDDTIGHVSYGTKIWDHLYEATLMSAYNMHEYYSPMENGWGVPTEWSPGAKKAYIKIAEWIKSGVINEDVGSASSGSWFNRWTSGLYGTRTVLIWNFSESSNNPDEMLFENIPGSKVLIGPGLTDNDGSGGRTAGYEEFSYTPSAGFFYVNSNVDDEKLERILQLFDYMCVDVEGETFCNYGLEGQNYTLDPDTSQVNMIDQETLPVEKRVWPGLYSTPSVSKTFAPTNEDGVMLNNIVFRYSLENWLPTTHGWIIAPSATELDLSLAWYQRESRQARVKAMNEFLGIVFFSGQDNIEEAWNTLMDTFDDLGFQEYLRNLNEHALLDEEFRTGEMVHPTDKYPE